MQGRTLCDMKSGNGFCQRIVLGEESSATSPEKGSLFKISFGRIRSYMSTLFWERFEPNGQLKDYLITFLYLVDLYNFILALIHLRTVVGACYNSSLRVQRFVLEGRRWNKILIQLHNPSPYLCPIFAAFRKIFPIECIQDCSGHYWVCWKPIVAFVHGKLPNQSRAE